MWILHWFPPSRPGGSDSKESACNAGDLGSILGLGRSLGGGHGNPLQYSCLENPHGQRSLAGYSPGGCRVGHDWATKHSTQQAYFQSFWAFQIPVFEYFWASITTEMLFQVLSYWLVLYDQVSKTVIHLGMLNSLHLSFLNPITGASDQYNLAQGPAPSRASYAWGLTLCSGCLEILKTFVLELCFGSEVWWDNDMCPRVETQPTPGPRTSHLPGCQIFWLHLVTTAALCPW